MPERYLWTEAADASAVVVVAHGANNTADSPFFEGIADGLRDRGIATLRFNFPYKMAGRSYPDRAPVLLDAWREALQEAERRAPELPRIASGKSLGGRMASMLAAEEGDGFRARALVFFGYPLHAPGKTENLRADHLPAIQVPMLFIQGTRDPLARFDLVQDVVRRLDPMARLSVVEDADHSFRVRGQRRADMEIGRELAVTAATFIRSVID